MPDRETEIAQLEAQLARCRKVGSALLRGKGPLETFEYDGTLYPLLPNETEFKWFCVTTGRAAWRTELEQFRPGIDAELRYAVENARIVCANPACGNTLTIDQKACPKCGGVEGVAMHRAPDFSALADAAGELAIPVDFRGPALTWTGLFWAIVFGAFVIAAGVFLGPRLLGAGLNSLAAKALGGAAALTLFLALQILTASRRGIVTVTSSSLEFRTSPGATPTVLSFSDVLAVNVERVRQSGLFGVPMNDEARITAYSTSAEPLYFYTNSHFSRPIQARLLATLAKAAPSIRLIA
jgi:hypothetical protein